MIVILTGAPGAGKGTQADLLAQREGFKQISTGDALRKHRKEGTEIGKKAQAIMDAGKLVSDDILLSILQTELEAARGFPVLLDGYPRNVAQARALEELVGKERIRGAIHLDVDPVSLVQRLSGRRTCVKCQASYHAITNPPKKDKVCDRCGSEVVQRPDDTEEKVKVRLGVYESETRPVLDFYKNIGLYHRVDGNGSTESVYKALAAQLRSLA